MEKKKKRKFSLCRILSIILICVFCAFSLSACVGGSSSGGGGNAGGGNETEENDGNNNQKPEEDKDEVEQPTYGRENNFSDANDVFLGAIGVYDVSGSDKVFYDKNVKGFLSFDELVNRQFTTLATVLYEGLNSIYGSGSGANSSFNISGYGNNISIAYDDLVSPATKTPPNSAVSYDNAMYGGYELVFEKESYEEYNPDTGDIIEVVEQITDIKYSDTVVSSNSWKNALDSSGDLINALKFIYLTTSQVNVGDNYLSFANNSNPSLMELKRQYEDIDFSVMNIDELDYNDITTIGFTRDYMWNVLYFMAYTIIGTQNMNNSIGFLEDVYAYNDVDSLNAALRRMCIQDIYDREDQGALLQNYKGYDRVLVELVENAFRVTINGIGISAFEEDADYVSAYPKFYRQQFLYYDDLDKIQDYQQEYDYSYDPDSEEEYKPEQVDGVNLRQLKRIILIPKMGARFKAQNFQVDMLFTNMKSKEGDFQVEVVVSGIAQNQQFSNIKVGFDDGSYEIKLSDGSVLKGEPCNEDVTAEGRLKIDNVYLSDDMQSISFSENDLMKYKFTNAESGVAGLSLDEIIDKSFTTSAEGLSCINLYNPLLNIDLNNFSYTINIEKNLLNLDYNYYTSSGNLCSEIPSAYLMSFSIYG